MDVNLPLRQKGAELTTLENGKDDDPGYSVKVCMGKFITTCVQAGIRRSLLGNSDKMRLIGEGTSYRVYQAKTTKAVDDKSYVLCAVKMLRGNPPGVDSRMYPHKKEYQTKQMQAFLREARILCHPSVKDHESVTKLLEFGWNTEGNEDEDDAEWQKIQPFLIVQYAQHRSLRDFLSSRLAREYGAGEELALDVVAGLEALHSCDIVHGDLKTANILICQHDTRKFCAKLSDFSHSIIGKSESVYLGTELYLPPEITPEQRSKRMPLSQLKACDLWAYGIVLYEMLGGQYFHDRESLDNLTDDDLTSLWKDEKISKRLSTLDRETADIWMSALRAALAPNAAERKTAEALRQIFDVTSRIVPAKGIMITDEQLSPLDVQAKRAIYDEKLHYREMLTELGTFGTPATMSKYLFYVAQASTYGMGGQLEQSTALFAYVFALGGIENANSSKDSYPPDMAMLANYQRILGMPAKSTYVTKAKDVLRESILSAEEDLSKYAPEMYYSERIKVYRKATIDRLKSIKLVFHPEISGVTDWSTLQKTTEEHDIALSTVIETSEGFTDLQLRSLNLVHFLCFVGDVDFVRRLAVRYSTQELRELVDSDGNTCLHWACKGGSAEAVKYLIEEVKFKPSTANKDGTIGLHWLPFFEPADMGAVVDSLSQGDASTETTTLGLFIPIHFLWLRGPPLHWAVSCRNKQAVEHLLRIGADINAEYGDYSALALAVELHMHEIAELLLEEGANMDKIGTMKRSAMHYLAGNASLIKRYVLHGNSMTQGTTNPIKAARRTIEKLLYYGCNIDAQDSKGNTALLKAVASPFERGDNKALYVVRELIRNGADRNAQNHDGDTVLHIAILHYFSDRPNHLVLFRMLMDEGLALMAVTPVRIDLRDRLGRTPRLLAALLQSGRDYFDLLPISTVKEEATADLLAKDNEGKSYLDLVNTPYEDTISFLKTEYRRLDQIGLGVVNHFDCS